MIGTKVFTSVLKSHRKLSTTKKTDDVVPLEEAKRFIKQCLEVLNTSSEYSEQLAEVLIIADYRGCYSHGMNRLDSNHFGIAGWYSMKALEKNMIGMAFTNTSPFLCPTRAQKAGLGTNPISVAAPGKNENHFVLDMATTAVAVGKIEMQQRKGELIPEGWAVDKNGKSTTDPKKARLLMPLGGSELTSGYKGYSLSHMVEIFCGVLGGASFGPFIRKWGSTDTPGNLGHCFVAINPECFAPGFEERVSDLNEALRKLKPVENSKPVLVAGDPEKSHMEMVDREGGIRYHINQIKAANEIAELLKVPPMKLQKTSA